MIRVCVCHARYDGGGSRARFVSLLDLIDLHMTWKRKSKKMESGGDEGRGTEEKKREGGRIRATEAPEARERESERGGCSGGGKHGGPETCVCLTENASSGRNKLRSIFSCIFFFPAQLDAGRVLGIPGDG